MRVINSFINNIYDLHLINIVYSITTILIFCNFSGPGAKQYEISYPTGQYISTSRYVDEVAPKLLSATFSNDGTKIWLSFDKTTNQGGFGIAFSCSKLFAFEGSNNATCTWLNNATVSILSTILSVGSTVRLLPYKITCATCVVCQNFTETTTLAIALSTDPPFS